MKKLPERIERVGLVANPGKASTAKLVQDASRWLSRNGAKVLVDVDTRDHALPKSTSAGSLSDLAKAVDLILVFGGDGTILRVVRGMDGSKTPILGINAGRLGFLTDVPAHSLKDALRKIWEGRVFVDERPLVEVKGEASGEPVHLHALNDITVTRGSASRMIELEVSVDDEILTRYRSDGLIISTPTGSTAYSLSAGGPILRPDADVFVLTPICPHTLSNRSVIISLKSTLKVRVVSQRVDTIASADGQVQLDLESGDVLTIRRSRRSVRLLHLEGSSFFDTLRRKLHWSGSNG